MGDGAVQGPGAECQAREEGGDYGEDAGHLVAEPDGEHARLGHLVPEPGDAGEEEDRVELLDGCGGVCRLVVWGYVHFRWCEQKLGVVYFGDDKATPLD